jgi:hypothetical protein
MFTSAEAVIAAGNSGKWVKVTDDERKAIIDSIPGANLVRGQHTVQKPALRHYDRGDYIVVCDGPVDAEKHPDDVAADNAQAIANAKALLGLPA